MSDTDPDRLAEDLERQADELEQRADRVQSEIDRTRGDWARKRNDPNVPGAAPGDAEAERPPDAQDEDAR